MYVPLFAIHRPDPHFFVTVDPRMADWPVHDKFKDELSAISKAFGLSDLTVYSELGVLVRPEFWVESLPGSMAELPSTLSLYHVHNKDHLTADVHEIHIVKPAPKLSRGSRLPPKRLSCQVASKLQASRRRAIIFYCAAL